MHAIKLAREIVNRRPPINIELSDEPLFRHEYEVKIKNAGAKNKRGALITDSGLVLFSNPFKTFADSLAKGRTLKSSLGMAVRGTRLNPTQRLLKAFIASDQEDSGYFHWIADVLPRLEFIVNSGGNVDLFELLVPYNANLSYVEASLEPFKLRAVRFGEQGEVFRIDELIELEKIAPSGNYRPKLMQAIRSRFQKYYGANPNLPKRVFISRSRAQRRKIVNESSLLEILIRNGIELVNLEDYSFADQVRLCSGAELIVGLHGAGLVNMLWANPSTRILELRFRGDSHNNCFFSLASAMGQDYHYFLVDKEKATEEVHLANAIVDVSKFGAVLDRVIKGV